MKSHNCHHASVLSRLCLYESPCLIYLPSIKVPNFSIKKFFIHSVSDFHIIGTSGRKLWSWCGWWNHWFCWESKEFQIFLLFPPSDVKSNTNAHNYCHYKEKKQKFSLMTKTTTRCHTELFSILFNLIY